MCLVLCNKYRLGNNLAMYDSSIVPQYLPGGGGFSVYQYTLENLYDMHYNVRNWWTSSNDNLPLVRYLGCTFKLYQSADQDYLFRYQTNYPMTSHKLTYPTTQPSLLMMLKNTVIIPSKKTKTKRKPYKRIHIKPPQQILNKWFFQQEIAKTPLLLTYTSACSLDNYYISTQSDSNNVTILTINTNIFQNRHFDSNEDYYCKMVGTIKHYLWASYEHTTGNNNPEGQQVIFLGNSKTYTPGKTFEEAKRDLPTLTWDTYKNTIHVYAGNPFHKDYMQPETHDNLTLYLSNKSPQEVLKGSENTRIDGVTKMTNTFVVPLRYSPNKDNGNTNSTYLLQNWKLEHGWDEPANDKLILQGFPLWTQWWGFIDFQKKQQLLTQVDTHSIFVTKTKTTYPEMPAIVPIDENFTKGLSPYENELNVYDANRWYPMVQYQQQAINSLLQSGPGTAKLNGKKTTEAKCSYTFYFKFGGSPAPMVTVKNPTEQPIYPVPSNDTKTTSLQDPTTPIQYYLSNFDERRHQLTEPATKRIKKDWATKTSIFTDSAGMDPPVELQTPQTSEDETTDSEEEKETLFQQLLNQRNKQRKLKLRIRKLISKIQSIE